MGVVESVILGTTAIIALVGALTSEPPASNPTFDAIQNGDGGGNVETELTDESSEAEENSEEQNSKAEEDQRVITAALEKAKQDTNIALAAKRKAEKATDEAKEMASQSRMKQQQAEKVAAAAIEEGKKAAVGRAQAEEKVKAADVAREHAVNKWRAGIPPEVRPTPAELEAAKKRLQYTEGCFHFAIAGLAGTGKSSLINAFRGMRNNDVGAAPTGITETTRDIGRYVDPRHKTFIWYDIPGAGTLTIRDWEYFKQQALYIFDCIVVLFDNRFTATDVAVLRNCAKFNIPSYIVRSKSSEHIRNMMKDMGYDSDDEDQDRDHRANLFTAAREKYILETESSVRVNLDEAKLPQQRVYIVDKDALSGVVKRGATKKVIHEVALVQDLLKDARDRRSVPRSS